MRYDPVRPHILAAAWALPCLSLSSACASGAVTPDAGAAAADATVADGAVDQGDADAERPARMDAAGPTSGLGRCGDGVLTRDEACDDGNSLDGDGCRGDCRAVERGYSCQPPGEPCRRVARCGDGVTVLPELCDDANLAGGDGCSERCKVELGFKCEGSPSQCVPTTCGDGKVEGAESCEDGNAMPFDGCSADCQNEPDCSAGACRAECGDGIVLDEACDDGNALDGDGCSSGCTLEEGFECTQPELGERMVIPIVLRDFRYGNPSDFQPGAQGRNSAVTGMVEPELDAEGKPLYTGAGDGFVESRDSFAMWYRDVPGVNSSSASELVLWNNGRGGFVNRSGDDGEPFQKTRTAYYCGNVGEEQLDAAGDPVPCTSATAADTECSRAEDEGLEILDCYVEGNTYRATLLETSLDGDPLFFPVDDETFTPASERAPALLPAPLYSDDWEAEPGEPLHNFSFTSEVRYWFEYTADQSYALDFTGDDDVWVFVNGRLAVDLGGIHTPVSGSVTLDATTAGELGLTEGEVYEIAVFQAERQAAASSYKLTLSGFNLAPSDCRPVCGDGLVRLGEECDDGDNAGGYGQCAADCTLGEYCGDGEVQAAHEDCDDGVNIGDPCPSGCRILEVI